MTDAAFVQDVIQRHSTGTVIHFAGLKAVDESVAQPLKYYANNLLGMVGLLQAMKPASCLTLVFSSSATIHGDPARLPTTESFLRNHTNPYDHTKLIREDMLVALRVANPEWRVGKLRYINPGGAHSSGKLAKIRPACPIN